MINRFHPQNGWKRFVICEHLTGKHYSFATG